MDLKKFAKMLLCIVACEFVGFFGAIFTFPAIGTWYVSLNKPFFNPPNWIFVPVWTVLYLLMGVSIYFVLEKGFNDKTKFGICFFSIQLALNFVWSMLFFGLKQPLFAFIEIVFLWISIALTIKEFFKISKKSAIILVPYLLWVTFASLLNLAIVLLN